MTDRHERLSSINEKRMFSSLSQCSLGTSVMCWSLKHLLTVSGREMIQLKPHYKRTFSVASVSLRASRKWKALPLLQTWWWGSAPRFIPPTVLPRTSCLWLLSSPCSQLPVILGRYIDVIPLETNVLPEECGQPSCRVYFHLSAAMSRSNKVD